MRATILLIAILMGCGGTSNGPSTDGFQVVAGANLVDTALAKPAQALTIRVNGGDSGVAVTFEPVPSPLGGQYTTVSGLGSTAFQERLDVATDRRGQAGARLWFGSKAGDGWIRITIPSANAIDSVRFTITPAALFALSADPSDTTILLGGTSTPRIGIADSYGNARPGDPYALRPKDDVTTATGGVIRGAKVGRSTVEVSAGNQRGDIYVAVAPAVDLAGVTNAGLATVRADGANFRLIVPVPLPGLVSPTRMSWLPDASAAVFDAVSVLYIARKNGTWLRLTDGSEAAQAPIVSGDGQWIYYARQTQGTWRIHRMRLDGTGDELVLGDAVPLTWPAPSPDGKYLAYIAANHELRILDLVSRVSTALHAPAATPAWSPDGVDLGFICADGPCLIRPDGSQLREVGARGGYTNGLSWSPDGRWLMTNNFVVQLVERSTGVAVPLTTRLGVSAVTWAR